MIETPAWVRVKFGEAVWHDEAYEHPQLKRKIPKDFYDRTDLLEQVGGLLYSTASRRPMVLVGERRAGKTSILKLLLHKAQNMENRIAVETPWAGINAVETLMQEILHGLYYALGLDNGDLLARIRELESVAEFHAIMTQFVKSHPGKTFVFGIDEFDSIVLEQVREPQNQSKILTFISSLSETSSLPIKIVLTSVKRIERIESHYSSNLAARSKEFLLKPFSQSDLVAMIKGITDNITDEEIAEISSLSGNWPYYAKSILYHLVQITPNESRLAQAQEKAVESLVNTWEHVYQRHWSDAERTVILLLAISPEKRLSLPDAEILNLDNAADRLVERGYLVKDKTGYGFRIGLLPAWFKRWPRFESEKGKYLKDVNERLARGRAPWKDGEDDVIVITREDLRRRGF